MFESTLGITLNNKEVLRKAILEAAANSDAAHAIGDNGHGMVYVLRFLLTTTNRTASILTAWIILHGEDFPRLVTCYIL